MQERDLNITEERGAKANIPDLKVYGDTDTFALLCKASSKEQGFSKSTKVCNLFNGCIVQVSTMQKNPDGSYAVAEALTFVPDVNMTNDGQGDKYLSESWRHKQKETKDKEEVCVNNLTVNFDGKKLDNFLKELSSKMKNMDNF